MGLISVSAMAKESVVRSRGSEQRSEEESGFSGGLDGEKKHNGTETPRETRFGVGGMWSP